MISFVLPLLGRFHPILVHLPIGILIFGIALVFLSKKGKASQLESIRWAFLLGGISAAFSSLSGFLQYQNEGFAWDSVQFHFYFGLLTTGVSFWLFFELKKIADIPSSFRWKSLGLTLLLLITGHLGGNITHGETYLTEVLPPEIQGLLGVEVEASQGLSIPAENWQQLAYYEQVVQPILNTNCKSCHNPRNSKGELDLSSYEGLLNGGENGAVFHASDSEKSDLFVRMALPIEDDNHMPPKEKKQPKKEELELIKLWLEKGASTTQTLGEAGVQQKLLEPFFIKAEIPFYPLVQLNPIPSDSLKSVKEKGFFVEPVFQDSPFLKVSCINFSAFSDTDLEALKGISQNLAYLDLSNTQVTEEILNKVSQFPNLTVLKLNQTNITGANLKALEATKNLKQLFLNDTKVTLEQLESLEKVAGLEKVFAFNTPVSEAENLKKFRFSLETKAYQLAPIPSDTIVY